MRDTVGPKFGVKASGGIRDMKSALAMIDAGATRLGTDQRRGDCTGAFWHGQLLILAKTGFA